MFKKHSRRSGFTLPEVLVTVAIVAVLAAMVVPAVTQQIGKGDAPAFSSSVNSLRTAVTSFVADTRKLPGQLDHLQLAIDGTDTDLSTATYNPAAVSGWKGPYDNSGNATGQLALGFGWTTSNALVDSLNYVVVTLTQAGAVTADAVALDADVDGATGPTAGLIRWTDNAGALDDPNTIKLFLMSSAK